ncbi:hypothetical protein BCR43DRAFT_449882 [Syncephalastrum racemosum]|uniref:Uncharacterized protein n=1 Tax=Syncephalastrum racemosum TaxID=13706 RepID=A0A1X2HUR6_SYNRA|nr:hypothetical protein BCR43DRAFT_449882 [Syncephalastrum racemosum]
MQLRNAISSSFLQAVVDPITSSSNSTTTSGINATPNEAVGPDNSEIITEFINLFCITLVAIALGSKTHKADRNLFLSYGRLLVIHIYIMSWSFATMSVLVISTYHNNPVSCTIGMFACDILYAGSKISIYAWLIERVHIVSSSVLRLRRLESWQYRFHLLLLCPFVGIAVLMLIYRNTYIRPNGDCVIGLKLIASIPVVIYDFFLNLYLSILFLIPLMRVSLRSRAEWTRKRLYKFTVRSLIASVICLCVSFTNAFVVVITRGEMRGLMCLTMCTCDVTINVIAIHYVTSSHRWFKSNDDSKKENELDPSPPRPGQNANNNVVPSSSISNTGLGPSYGNTGELGQSTAPTSETINSHDRKTAAALFMGNHNPVESIELDQTNLAVNTFGVINTAANPISTVDSYERNTAAAMFTGDFQKVHGFSSDFHHGHDDDDFSIKSIQMSQTSLSPLQRHEDY